MTLDRKDFVSSTEVKWCPGCGNYGVLKSLTTVFAEIGLPKEQYLIVSGIGCSSRLPYYADTYGVHSIHGRAPTFAMGAKMTHPELCVWVISGDGDSLSIGTNHFVHLARRNPDINFLLFNNMIYGLTKGQASPTSPMGLRTKSTPEGQEDLPLNALKLAHAAGASFIARATDTNPALLKDIMHKAVAHKGTSIIEVMVNCIIFNDGAFQNLSQKSTRDDTTVILEEGKPLIFGKEKNKLITLDGLSPKVEEFGDAAEISDKAPIHKLGDGNELYVNMLTNLLYPDHPVPLGVLHQVERPVYEDVHSSNLKDIDDWDYQEVEDFILK